VLNPDGSERRIDPDTSNGPTIVIDEIRGLEYLLGFQPALYIDFDPMPHARFPERTRDGPSRVNENRRSMGKLRTRIEHEITTDSVLLIIGQVDDEDSFLRDGLNLDIEVAEFRADFHGVGLGEDGRRQQEYRRSHRERVRTSKADAKKSHGRPILNSFQP
jgi:hypothetical protein